MHMCIVEMKVKKIKNRTILVWVLIPGLLLSSFGSSGSVPKSEKNDLCKGFSSVSRGMASLMIIRICSHVIIRVDYSAKKKAPSVKLTRPKIIFDWGLLIVCLTFSLSHLGTF